MASLKRLKRALSGLRSIRRNEKALARFDLSLWAQLPVRRRDRKAKPDLTCASAACAVGSLILRGEMPGMKYKIDGEGKIWPRFKSKKDFEAVGIYFGVSKAVAEALFDPHDYPDMSSALTGATGVNRVIGRLETVIKFFKAPKAKREKIRDAIDPDRDSMLVAALT